MKKTWLVGLFMLVLALPTTHAQEAFLGEIRMFAGNFAPRGWAFCDGQIVSIQQNPALFSLLGTMYGGDGRSTFALPDLRSRVPVHAGQGAGLSNIQQGEKGGTESYTLTTAQLPSHNHGTKLGFASNGEGRGTISVATGEQVHLQPQEGQTAGSGQPINNMQPYLGVRYIICMEGLYPSRN